MSEIIKTLGCCALLVTLGSGCWPGRGGGVGGGSGIPKARQVQFFNCTHVNGPTQPPSGRAFNVYSRVDGGAWVARGGLNPQPGDWTDCHDAPHEASSLTLDLLDPAGKWEVRTIRLPRGDEPSCDSSAPDVANACSFGTYFFQTDVTASTVQVNVTDSDG